MFVEVQRSLRSPSVLLHASTPTLQQRMLILFMDFSWAVCALLAAGGENPGNCDSVYGGVCDSQTQHSLHTGFNTLLFLMVFAAFQRPLPVVMWRLAALGAQLLPLPLLYSNRCPQAC
jgi:hypothetical protein